MWRCFHCKETFWLRQSAAAHFGPTIYSPPACQMSDAGVRALEAELGRYRDEDTDLHRQICSMQAEHATALRREEEKGYARGLAEGTRLGDSLVEGIQKAVERYFVGTGRY